MPNFDNLKYDFTRKRLTKAKLLIADDTNLTDEMDMLGTFYLNPMSISESKASNWVAQIVPGTSDPHLQWTSGGARTIKFEALITKDQATYPKDSDKSAVTNNSKTSIVKRMGAIAVSAFNLAGLTLNDVTQNRNSAELNLDISKKLNYYRSLLYPTLTSNSNRIDSAPPLVYFIIGTSLGKRDTIKYVVTQVDIQVTKFYPTLAPIEAIVSFTLVEYTEGLVGFSDIV